MNSKGHTALGGISYLVADHQAIKLTIHLTILDIRWRSLLHGHTPAVASERV